MKKLNLGCGSDIKGGYINLDLVKNKGVDVVHNLNKTPWPFKKNEFSEIYVCHVLEHLEDVLKILNEIYRISKDNCKLHIISPYYSNVIAYHFSHKHFFALNTFDQFESEKNCSDFKCKIAEKRLYLFDPFLNRNINTSRKILNKIFNPLINKFSRTYERFFSNTLPCACVEHVMCIKKSA